MKRLREEIGFVQVLTMYFAFRRAACNVINDNIDDFNSNEALRNLVLDHANSVMFHKNYLSHMIRYDTQATYRGALASNVSTCGEMQTSKRLLSWKYFHDHTGSESTLE